MVIEMQTKFSARVCGKGTGCSGYPLPPRAALALPPLPAPGAAGSLQGLGTFPFSLPLSQNGAAGTLRRFAARSRRCLRVFYNMICITSNAQTWPLSPQPSRIFPPRQRLALMASPRGSVSPTTNHKRLSFKTSVATTWDPRCAGRWASRAARGCGRAPCAPKLGTNPPAPPPEEPPQRSKPVTAQGAIRDVAELRQQGWGLILPLTCAAAPASHEAIIPE